MKGYEVKAQQNSNARERDSQHSERSNTFRLLTDSVTGFCEQHYSPSIKKTILIGHILHLFFFKESISLSYPNFHYCDNQKNMQSHKACCAVFFGFP